MSHRKVVELLAAYAGGRRSFGAVSELWDSDQEMLHYPNQAILVALATPKCLEEVRRSPLPRQLRTSNAEDHRNFQIRYVLS
jgi:hypothetical protein